MRARRPNDTFALVTGLLLLAAGLLGLAAGDLLLGFFRVSPTHDAIHLASGALLLASIPLRRARLANLAVGLAYLAIVVASLVAPIALFDAGVPVNLADDALHTTIAVALLGVAFLAKR